MSSALPQHEQRRAELYEQLAQVSPASVKGPPVRQWHGTGSGPLSASARAMMVLGWASGQDGRVGVGAPRTSAMCSARVVAAWRRRPMATMTERCPQRILTIQAWSGGLPLELAEPKSISTVTGGRWSRWRARWARTRQAGEQNRAGRPVPGAGTAWVQWGPAQMASAFES